MVEFKEVQVTVLLVTIRGKTFQLADWAKWVAVDMDGDIYQYPEKPHITEDWWDTNAFRDGSKLFDANCMEFVEDWEDQIYEVKA